VSSGDDAYKTTTARDTTLPASQGSAPPTARGVAALPGVGARIDRYELIGVLGRGGMGTVYRARDPRLGRDVALKLVHPGALGHARSEEQLAREGQAMARLSHRNVVTVFDVGTAGDHLYIAMELVEGTTLRGWLKERSRSWREVIDVLERAGRGLAAAHDAGLVHRDFKPDNVLIGADGEPRVTDFGLAKLLSTEAGADSLDGAFAIGSSDPDLTHGTAIVGTPAYMAPEQRQGRRFDVRADQFAFCVTAWEALFGVRPQVVKGGEDKAATPEARPKPRRVPRWLRGAVERGLAQKPEERWPSLRALLDAVARRRARTRFAVVAAAGVAAVVGGVVAATALVMVPSEVRPRRGDAAIGGAIAGTPTTVLRRRRDDSSSIVLLDDGKTLASIVRDEIWLRDREGVAEKRLEVHAPGGALPWAVHSSGQDGWLVVDDKLGGACSVWHVSTAGEPSVLLAPDPTCQGGTVDVSPGGRAMASVDGARLLVTDLATRATRTLLAGERHALNCPAWSRDGRFIAVVAKIDGLRVLDAATGEVRHQDPDGGCGRWIAPGVLAYPRGHGIERAELRLLWEQRGDQAWVSEGVYSIPDAVILEVTGGHAGVLVRSLDYRRSVYQVPIRRTAPVRISDIAAVPTEASNDFVTMGWLGDHDLVVLSRIGRDRVLIRTSTTGEHSVVHRIGPIGASLMTAFHDGILYSTGENRDCKLHRFARRDGVDRSDAIPVPCDGTRAVCPPRGLCVVWTGGVAHWFDPETMEIKAALEPARPVPESTTELAPDGHWLVAGNSRGFVWTDVRTGAEKQVVLSPPARLVPGYGFSIAPDGRVIAVLERGHGSVVIEVQPDGHWLELATSDELGAFTPTLSPDGVYVGFITQENPSLWTHVPLDLTGQGRTTTLP